MRAARQVCRALRPRGAEKAFRALRASFYERYWSEAAAAAGAELRELGAGFRQARRGNAWTVIRSDQIGLDDQLRARLARNKTATAKLLAPLGFVTPESVSFGLDSSEKGLAFLASARGPVVVNPDGIPQRRFFTPSGPGAGRGVTCGVRTPQEFARAARWASLFGSELIVEKHVEGASYRLLYLDGHLIDAVRRDSPRVFGDGVSTLAELVDAENAERLAAQPPVALSPLTIDLDCRLTLARQGLVPRSVPKAMQAVTVKTACNQNAAYDNHIVRDLIHPQLAQLGAALVKFLGLRLAGVDLMSRDPSLAPAQGGSVFSEINANPGLHHHWLVAEAQRRAPVGKLVLEAALS